MKVTCASCNKKSEIADPADDALERNADADGISVGVTHVCDHCGETTYTEVRREEIVVPPPPPRWDAQRGEYVTEEASDAK